MYKELVSPVLDRLDSEIWHVRAREALHFAESNPFTLKILELAAADHHRRFSDKRLNVVVGGVSFENPVLVGAGWDKNARAIKALHRIGFAGVEVGSVLEHPQPGNEKPRQFMLGQGVALNRLGFNSPGMEVVAKNLEGYRGSGIPIGISVGKNKEVSAEDAPRAHAAVVDRLYSFASYIALNVSSPNTPGLRGLQERGQLTDNVQAINDIMDKHGKRLPFFVKVDPDMPNDTLNGVIQVVTDNGLTGIIATNTTVDGDIKAGYGEQWRKAAGGLSGADEKYQTMSTERVKHIYTETGGKIDVIGVGGIYNTRTALLKIAAGARLIQIVTGIRGEGPTIAGRINRGIVAYMDSVGIKDVSEIVGSVSKPL